MAIGRARFGGRHLSAPVKSGPPREPPRPAPAPPPWWRRWLLPVGLAVTALLLLVPMFARPSPQPLSYSEFLAKLDAGAVTSVTVAQDGALQGRLTDGAAFTSQIPTALDPAPLTAQLRAKNVQITATRDSGSWWAVLLSFLPLLLLLAFFYWTGRRAQGALADGVTGFGRSRAKIIEAQRPMTRFADVAGYEGVKQEIGEIVDFLRAPDRYASAGAKGPRGVLMVGPPGTGKTLLGRAVAGEAEVPFLSVTGSAFVEMFVGVGASRVRDLFEEARRRAPSIIFIDEIDAIGGRRGGHGRIGDDEREQTLNQLLAEMDGFDQRSGIVVLAATNRPESLDPALLRPGRFDRQVVIPLPNQAERAAILAVHVRGKHLAPDVDLLMVARATPGFSGADLENLVNEAAIRAVRADRTTIEATDIDAARDRLLLGRRETSNALLPEERRAVAVHESGHALLAALCPHADPIAKVTILPAGMALGATEQLPEAERHLYHEGYLTDLLTVKLGGRSAELLVLGVGSTGAANDLAAATQIATRMVREFGLSQVLGPVGYATSAPHFLGEEPDEQPHRPYSEQTQQIVDREVGRLLREAQDRALAMLREHETQLRDLAELLERQETVDGGVVLDVLAGHHPGAPTDQAAAGDR
ncbi:ATP-dependent zinc metalloprotease FtsH [Catellatospora sp. IY07-71]|uniref:ATP-dependent zinc metalloprotease FtsH n=1 Tax=Catellatospora sp. IY07-71 TaxID=2728827 RepID=UPI001BB30276|nr:ATP-dependent zinc metalloprotease FtsH [Catellatospora sp. IY07-71]BCJ75826.1 ATP-dependent zinc metalloprotease FtsH [Catellatospora sp. IY07-71]